MCPGPLVFKFICLIHLHLNENVSFVECYFEKKNKKQKKRNLKKTTLEIFTLHYHIHIY